MIILDTNVLSELLRVAPDSRVLAWFGRQSHASLFTTAVNRAELLFGVRLLPDGKRRETMTSALRTIFDTVLAGRVLSFDGDAADAYAEIAVGRRASGRPISQSDAMIAAMARSRGADLATRNTKDFVDCAVALVDPWNCRT